MAAEIKIVSVTTDLADNAYWLSAAEQLHRTLRPDIPHPYADYMGTMFAEGAAMAALIEGDVVRAIAVYRHHHTTFHGLRFYVDDLVTEEVERGRGLGRQLLDWCETRARDLNCDTFDLESGVQRPRTHKFYFRHDLEIFAFGFTKKLLRRLHTR